MAKIYIYKRFVRFWHWTQAILIFLLILTGFEIHGSFTLFGFQQAIDIHDISAYLFLILMAFAIFWHFSTGEWRQYLPTSKYVKEMIRYYLVGIFKGEHHPVRKTELSKLNPLQKIIYSTLKLVLIPLQVITGLLYLFYNSWPEWGIVGGKINVVAALHTAGAFAFLIFILAHIYLTTTGTTIFSNIKAMIVGWEETEETETKKDNQAVKAE